MQIAVCQSVCHGHVSGHLGTVHKWCVHVSKGIRRCLVSTPPNVPDLGKEVADNRKQVAGDAVKPEPHFNEQKLLCQ